VSLFEELKAKAGQDYLVFSPLEDLWPLIDRFVEHVDARWAPVLEAAYHRQARLPDVHKKVIPGVVLGLAAASGSASEFFERAPESSTAAFEGDRRREYARGLARFASDPRAMKWLTAQAEDRIRRVNEWDVGPNGAYEALITTRTPQARKAVERVLDAKTIDGRNWQLLLDAAAAAARIGATNALPGIERMRDRIHNRPEQKRAITKAIQALRGGR
jgi:hypothetical protein